MDEWQNQLGYRPTYQFHGPVENLPANVLEAMHDTLIHALQNMQRHAHASGAFISVTVAEVGTQLVIADNGGGAGNDPQGRGIDKMRANATNFGGQMLFTEPPGGGTQIVWTVPVLAQT